MSLLFNMYGENPHDGKYRSFSKLVFMISTYSLSYFYIGYTMAYFTTFQSGFLTIKYGLALTGFFRVLYLALIAFGAGFGTLLSQIIVQKYPKRYEFALSQVVYDDIERICNFHRIAFTLDR